MSALTTTPFAVQTPDNTVKVIVMNKSDDLPTAFALHAANAKRKVALRISGGCGNMTDADKEDMVAYFLEAFRGYEGVLFSGATRQAKDGKIDPMVTDIPGLIAQANPGCIALGTVPRTGLMQLVEESRLVLDPDGTAPSPNQSAILIVQDGPDKPSEWDGDLNVYFQLMENWRDAANFTSLGLTSWNGGGVTLKEIMTSASKGWPTFLIGGSGRKTDEVIAKLEASDEELLAQLPEGHKIIIAEKDDPQTLRDALIKHGFLGF